MTVEELEKYVSHICPFLILTNNANTNEYIDYWWRFDKEGIGVIKYYESRFKDTLRDDFTVYNGIYIPKKLGIIKNKIEAITGTGERAAHWKFDYNKFDFYEDKKILEYLTKFSASYKKLKNEFKKIEIDKDFQK